MPKIKWVRNTVRIYHWECGSNSKKLRAQQIKIEQYYFEKLKRENLL